MSSSVRAAGFGTSIRTGVDLLFRYGLKNSFAPSDSLATKMISFDEDMTSLNLLLIAFIPLRRITSWVEDGALLMAGPRFFTSSSAALALSSCAFAKAVANWAFLA